MSFDALVADLEVLQKAQTMKKGDEPESMDSAGSMPEGDPAEGSTEDEEDEEEMGKSFSITLENGEVVEATDGTAMLKSLKTETSEIRTGMEAFQGQVFKAMSSMAEIVKNQADLIKSLEATVGKLRGTGAGRKAVLSVMDRPAEGQGLQKSQAPQLNAQEFMAKCDDAFSNGRLNGAELRAVETSINNGVAVPDSIIRKVLA